MIRLVTDASVLAKWRLQEPHTEAARQLLFCPHTLHAPALMAIEVHNVIVKKRRRNQVIHVEACRLRNETRSLSIVYVPDMQVLAFAFDISLNEDLTMCDALYTSASAHLDATLVTEDARLYRAVACAPYAPRVVWVEDTLV
ncbi:MAG: type II toxin-antitoxin system VapC family toxin [Candidatus Hydrogenedentes bacterium]|nr:type II toxin-antitoxin system VapC family toxin [Candidatus Hydrogenedentota bacterium]